MIAVEHETREDGARELEGGGEAEDSGERPRCGILSDAGGVFA